MPITAIGPGPPLRGTGWRIKQTFTQSTASTAQSISPYTDLCVLGVGTATGFLINVYTLASSADGKELSLLVTGTGEAKVAMTGTATGLWVLTEADDRVRILHENGKWYIQNSTATLATST